VGQEALPNKALKIELKLTSQTWKGILLEHRLRLIKPEEISNPTLVLMIITGSGSGREELIYGTAIASGIKAPVAILYDVPYQPPYKWFILAYVEIYVALLPIAVVVVYSYLFHEVLQYQFLSDELGMFCQGAIVLK
jgi:hypothetical protein